MDKYLSGNEILRRWDIKNFQLFNLCKKGELQPYNGREEKVVTRESYIMTKEDEELITKETEELKRLSRGTLQTGKVLRVSGQQYLPSEPPTDEEFKSRVIKWFTPKGCEWFDYSLPQFDSAANQKIKKFMAFYFKESDVKRYEIEHDLFKPKKDVVEIGQAANEIIEKKIFPCDPGTKWEEVKITLTSNEKVRIKTPKGEGSYNFSELGMVDGRNKTKPTSLWRLLVIFARTHGFLTLENMEDEKDKKNLTRTASRLNKHLQELFGINESIYEGHYKKLKRMYSDHEIGPDQNIGTASREPRRTGYKTRIFFSDQTKVVK